MTFFKVTIPSSKKKNVVFQIAAPAEKREKHPLSAAEHPFLATFWGTPSWNSSERLRPIEEQIDQYEQPTGRVSLAWSLVRYLGAAQIVLETAAAAATARAVLLLLLLPLPCFTHCHSRRRVSAFHVSPPFESFWLFI